MSLISCSNWSLPLKYDSTIWSFIKLFSGTAEKDVVFKKKKIEKRLAVYFIGGDCEEEKEGRKEEKRKDECFPLSVILVVSESLRWSPCARRPLLRAAGPRGGNMRRGRSEDPNPLPNPAPACLCEHNWAELAKDELHPHHPAWKDWFKPHFF